MTQRTVTSGAASRRAVLRSGAALAGVGLTGVGSVAAAPADGVTVLTQNLYLGSALAPALEAETEAEFEAAVADAYRNVLESRFDRRARALAGEIAEVEPDVIGLQEAARFAERGSGATTRDYLRTLVEELEAAGLSYAEAASVKTFDAEFSLAGDAASDAVRFVNRDAILARDGVATSDADAGTYYAGGLEFGIGRGYCSVTVADAYTFVDTHLSTARTPFLQVAQAAELVSRFRGAPTVLVGDFNSGPDAATERTYEILTERYTDAYAAANPERDGPTCCRDPTLTEDTALDRRIDHVFASDDVRTRGAERIATDRAERAGGRWPSDHAGVAAELTLP